MILCAKLRIAISISLLVLPVLTTSRPVAYGQSAQSDKQASPLEQGKTVEREIRKGETHCYQIALAAGEFLGAEMDRQGLNLSMTFLSPDGRNLIELNRSSYPLESVPLVFVAKASGVYGLEVRLPAADKTSGHYKVTVRELRAATAEDLSRVKAEWTFIEAQQLSEQGSAESHRKAIEKHEEALALYRALDDAPGQARALNFIGWAYSELTENRKALDYYSRSLALYRVAGSISGEAIVLNNTGLAYSRLSDPAKAIEFFNQAAPLRRAAGDRQGEAITLNNTGMAYARLSEYRKALDHLNQALPIYQSISHRRLEAGVLYNIGQMYTSLGEWQKAISCHDRALPVARAIGNNRLEANILVALGAVFSVLSEHQKALDYYARSLPLHRLSGNRTGEANTLVRIGRISRLSSENRNALDSFNQALAIFRATGDLRGQSIALRDIGQLYDYLGEKQKAIDYLNQALPVARAASHRDTEAGVLNDLGSLYTSLNEYQKALDYLNQSIALYRSIGNPASQAQSLYDIARAYRGQGDLEAARSHSHAALRIVESQRGKVASPESRASYFASVRKLYDLDIDLLMQLHHREPSKKLDRAAFETSERARARSLLELLVEARADIRQGVDRALLERERLLGELINAKAERQTQMLSGKHTPKQAAQAAKEIESLLTEHQQLEGQIRMKSPRYAALTQPQPASLSDIQHNLIDSDTLLLEYALGEERSYLWAVSNTLVTSYELSKREEIEAAARRYYELLRKAGEDEARSRRELEEAAQRLSRMLLSPAADRLQSKRLVIVADGILHYIPFAALPAPQVSGVSAQGPGKETAPLGRVAGAQKARSVATAKAPRLPTPDPRSLPLIADHEIVGLPSASVLAEMRREIEGRKPARRAVAVFADPVFSHDDARLKKASNPKSNVELLTEDIERAMRDIGSSGFPRLPFSRREAEAIVAAAPRGQSIKALDFEASRVTATSDELSDYRIVHFATHGLLNSNHPELSGIVLSLVDRDGQPQSGFLRLHEVHDLKLPAEMVVLSACQTALGKDVRGEGVIGLTRGFMYAGAARIVASLWKVNDAATAELMKRFYRKIFAGGLRPAAALRQAQMEMLKDERWRSPYYWAAFVLQGEWR